METPTKNRVGKGRWLAVAVFFIFMLLHQSDKLLFSPLIENIKATFGINDFQIGLISTGALVVGAICYPLWGYLYDHFARPKLLALASFIWGATTWISAIAPTYPIFLATRASTGIDDSSYPGLYSLVADYFGPKVRGKIYGLLQLTMPLGYLIGMVLALMLKDKIGWRSVFYITGSLGIVVAILILVTVKETPRGSSEPELAKVEDTSKYKFSWKYVRALFKMPTMLLIFAQGFFGVFPWNVITIWFFSYLERERHYDSTTILFTMAPAVLILAAGYPLGGALGDALFKRTDRGRAIVSTIGVLLGAILLYFTMRVPIEQQTLFFVLLCATALFIPFAASNVVATVYDITVPEIRSTANAVESFMESIGAALSPMIAGAISVMLSLKDAILIICISTWILCAIFFTITAFVIPTDINKLRTELRRRAESSGEDESPAQSGAPAVEGSQA